MIKLAIIGSRDFEDFALLEREVLAHFDVADISLIVSGGARGADKLGEVFAKKYKIETLIFLPQWDVYGKSAGFRRNKDIVENADVVMAFWNGSKGTAHIIKLAEESGKKVIIIKI